MNTNKKNSCVQTEAGEQDTKTLGLSNVKGDKQLCLKKITPTSDIVQAGVITNSENKEKWYHLFLGKSITKEEEHACSMEELNSLTPAEILELCARMILTNDALKIAFEQEQKNNL